MKWRSSLTALLLSGCNAHLPPPPQVEPCRVVAATPEQPWDGCLCSKADGSATYFLPIAACAGYFALSKEHAKATYDYVNELQRELVECRSR